MLKYLPSNSHSIRLCVCLESGLRQTISTPNIFGHDDNPKYLRRKSCRDTEMWSFAIPRYSYWGQRVTIDSWRWILTRDLFCGRVANMQHPSDEPITCLWPTYPPRSPVGRALFWKDDVYGSWGKAISYTFLKSNCIWEVVTCCKYGKPSVPFSVG